MQDKELYMRFAHEEAADGAAEVHRVETLEELGRQWESLARVACLKAIRHLDCARFYVKLATKES